MNATLTSALLLCSTLFGTTKAEPILILIGGNHSDPSPAQLAGEAGRGGNSGLWRLRGDLLSEDKLEAEYFNWNGTRAGEIDAPHPGGAHAIAAVIREQHRQHPDARIILVGNSWGGHTAWQVCELLGGKPVAAETGGQRSIDASSLPPEPASGTLEGRTSPPPDRQSHSDSGSSNRPTTTIVAAPGDAGGEEMLEVDLVILLDPSSFGRSKEPKPTEFPANLKRAVNYYTHNSFSWSRWPDEPRMENVDLGHSDNGFLYPGGPKYDSVLNWQAHVAAEWDERIHADIRRRIGEAVAPTADP